MKILYRHRIASKDGQYVHVEEIIRALSERGHKLIVVGPKVATEAAFGSDGGWVSSLRRALPKWCSELLEFGYAFYVFFKLLVACLKHRPDAIYERYNLFLPSGIWVKKLLGLKLVLEVNSPLYLERAQYGGISLASLAKWTERYTWCNADHVCPVTHVLAGYLLEAGVSEDNITVIPNGIDPSVFHPNQNSVRRPEFTGKLTIGFVGFCREWHQLDKVLSLIAASKNPDLMLLIVGDGPVAIPLQQQAEELGIATQLHVTGLVERHAMPMWLDQIDIALQPAVTPWSSPLKLIEYLAKGKAIIAPDRENIRELLVDGNNALLYPVDAPDAIFVRIKQIVEDDVLRALLQRQALQTIKDRQLTWAGNAARIESIFSTLTTGASAASRETK